MLQDYVKFIRENEEELLPGLIHNLESAIKYNYSIDSILAEFEERIEVEAEYYETNRNRRYYIDFTYLLGEHYANNGYSEIAINNTLKALTSSVKLQDDTGFRKSTALYELLREHTTPIQQHEYKNIMLNIIREGVKQ